MKATQPKFRHSIFGSLRASALILIACTLMACQGETNAQTVDASKYKSVAEPITVSSGKKIQVTELFWYGCGHCFALEPHVQEWKKNLPENVSFVKVPAIFSARWEFHAQAFYTIEALGLPDTTHQKFFEAIHIKRQNINSIKALSSFLEPFGKTEDEVTSAFNSFAVDSNMRNATKITRSSGATGVPAIIVDGKYLTSESQAGKGKILFSVVDQLVEKAAAER